MCAQQHIIIYKSPYIKKITTTNFFHNNFKCMQSTCTTTINLSETYLTFCPRSKLEGNVKQLDVLLLTHFLVVQVPNLELDGID